jgi:hypothetical protein
VSAVEERRSSFSSFFFSFLVILRPGHAGQCYGSPVICLSGHSVRSNHLSRHDEG